MQPDEDRAPTAIGLRRPYRDVQAVLVLPRDEIAHGEAQTAGRLRADRPRLDGVAHTGPLRRQTRRLEALASYRGGGVGDAAKRLNSILPTAAQLSAAGFDLNTCRFHAIAFLVCQCFKLKTSKANMHRLICDYTERGRSH